MSSPMTETAEFSGDEATLTIGELAQQVGFAPSAVRRLTLLDRSTVEPGETAWVQIRFGEPVAVRKGDRFIARRPSPWSKR